jgi:glutamate carboxypeptidase
MRSNEHWTRPMHRSLALLALVASAPAATADLSGTERRIVNAVDANQAAAMRLIAETVDIQSATENHAGVRKVGDVFARELAKIGFETRWVDLPPQVGRAGHLVAVHGGTGGKRLLLIGHLDTVLQGEAFRVVGDRAYGTGIADMKGGNVIVVEALRALQATGALEDRQVIVVFTGDEEDTGAPRSESRKVLFDAAEESDVALAFEGAAAGVAVVGRRGIGAWRLHVNGEQAHSSGIFREGSGYGAIFEAARILDRFRLDLPEQYLTFNPSVMAAGTNVVFDAAASSGTATGKINVIPREARLAGDIRFMTTGQFDAAQARMQAIVADSLPGTSASIEFEIEYPSMAPTDGNREVLAVLDTVSRDLGAGPIVAQDPGERGAGDISFVCSGRLACLDGLGAMGDKDHAPGEYMAVPSLRPLTQRAALLIYRLTR